MEKKRTKTEERAHSEMLIELAEMDIWMQEFRLKEGFIPEGWADLDETAPLKRPKEKITLTLDRDVLKWFRGMGRGYSARINAVLRVYMLALVSKEVMGRGDLDWKGDPI